MDLQHVGLLGDINRPEIAALNCGVFIDEKTNSWHPFEFNLEENQKNESQNQDSNDSSNGLVYSYGTGSVALSTLTDYLVNKFAREYIEIREVKINKSVASYTILGF